MVHNGGSRAAPVLHGLRITTRFHASRGREGRREGGVILGEFVPAPFWRKTEKKIFARGAFASHASGRQPGDGENRTAIMCRDCRWTAEMNRVFHQINLHFLPSFPEAQMNPCSCFPVRRFATGQMPRRGALGPKSRPREAEVRWKYGGPESNPHHKSTSNTHTPKIRVRMRDLAAALRETPGILLLVAVVQRLDFLLSLPL